MNKQEFMSQLDRLLLYMPVTEREAALQYYNDYFADAGEENEQEVLAGLGEPEAVAEKIKNDFYTGQYDIYEEAKVEKGKELGDYRPLPEKVNPPKQMKKLSTGWIVFIIIVCVILTPLLFTLLGSLAGVLAGVLGTILGIILALAIISPVVLVVGIVFFVLGIMATSTSIAAGLGIIGIGMILMAVGILAFLLLVVIVGKCIPGIFKGIGKLFRRKKRV